MKVKIWLASVSLALLGANVCAGTLYSNGAINGTFGAYDINSNAANHHQNYSVSNSFTLNSDALIGSAEIGLWTVIGDMPVSLQWSIGSSPFSADYGTGSATLSNIWFANYQTAYEIFLSSFNLDVAVSAGTSWLTLSNALGQIPDSEIAWDANSGPSSALDNGAPIKQSEYFKLSTDQVPVPEPSSLYLSGIGILVLLKRRRKS